MDKESTTVQFSLSDKDEKTAFDIEWKPMDENSLKLKTNNERPPKELLELATQIAGTLVRRLQDAIDSGPEAIGKLVVKDK